MKHSLFIAAQALSLVLAFGMVTSCNSTSILPFQQNEIKADSFVINTYLDHDEWVIIDTAIGESDFVGPRVGEDDDFVHEGDSRKYGYISVPEEPFLGQTDDGKRVYVGTGKTRLYYDFDNPVDIATLNANYNLIEQAFAMGGDSILDPIYTVQSTVRDGDKVFYKVTARAKVIKIQKK